MIPEDKNIVDEACESLYNAEENGFLDLMFDTESRVTKEQFCDRMLSSFYFFLQPHKIRNFVYMRIQERLRE